MRNKFLTSADVLSRRAFGVAAAGLALAPMIRPVFAQSPKRGGKISVAFVGSPVRLDPHVATGAEEWALLRSVYDSLIFADQNLALHPELAERWESSPDSTVWTSGWGRAPADPSPARADSQVARARATAG